MNETTTPEMTLPVQKNYKVSDVILSLFVMAAAFFFIKYAVFRAKGFITTGLFISIITAAVIYFKKNGFRFSRVNKIITGVLYVFSLVFSITANSLIKNLDAVFLFFGGAYLLFSVGADKESLERFLPFAVKKSVLNYPFSKFGEQFKVSVCSAKGSKLRGSIKYIIAGLVLTVPVTLTVAVLLMKADAGMEMLLYRLEALLISADRTELIANIVLALPCSLYLFGMFWANSHREDLNALNDDYCTYKLMNMRIVNNLICYTAVTPVCLLYILFFFTQTKYFLSAFTGYLPEGFTYADYARHGFFELLWVSIINLGLICVINLYSKKSGEEKTITLRFYTVTLSIFTVVLIATALSKMFLYIDQYGLTCLRVYTSWFMLLLAMIFVMIIIKQFRLKFDFSRNFCIVFTLMFGLLCFSRPESLIAKYNIEMNRSGKLEDLDINALLDMSDDGRLTAYRMGAVTEKEVYREVKYYYYVNKDQKYNLSSMALINSIDLSHFS